MGFGINETINIIIWGWICKKNHKILFLAYGLNYEAMELHTLIRRNCLN